MGIIGGTLGYYLLKGISSSGKGISSSGNEGAMDGSAYLGKSKLSVLLGKTLFDELSGKTVIDFGFGEGAEAIEIAKRGAHKVIGLDIQEKLLQRARERAAKEELLGRCVFASGTDEKADVITAIDPFEHFENPTSILIEMQRLLKPNGCVSVAFGPTWFHPLGGHLFSIFPWAHLVFTEQTLIRWRADFKSDGAKSFLEVAGGLNRMTISRFERIVAKSPFCFDQFEAVPIRLLRFIANRFTREFTTAIVRCRLVLR